MPPIFDRLGSRIVPAILTATGIALTTAGLLSYIGPGQVDGQASEAPSFATATSTPSTSLITFPPIQTGSPTVTATPSSPPASRVSTRVLVPALDIDLPIVKPPSGFPYCNVAMYLAIFSQPGLPGATYLFAHARAGMFLPLLTHENNDSMIGMTVWVYTSDDQVFLYRIFRVRTGYPASASLRDLPVKDGQLWLQTSEGPYSSSTKLQVVASFLSSHAVSHEDAHPKAHPVVCG
jgi:hypothetical protein